MKTEAIRQAAERLRASGHFGLASQVEEEADAFVECARTLRGELVHELDGVWHTDECWNAPIGLGCTERCKNIHAVLRKAGAL